jgi:hypothetical protein
MIDYIFNWVLSLVQEYGSQIFDILYFNERKSNLIQSHLTL